MLLYQQKDLAKNLKKRFFYSLLAMSLLICSPANAWWSGKNNAHYELTLLSKDALIRLGLFQYKDQLKSGSNAPDNPKGGFGVFGAGKALQHHRIKRRMSINLEEAIRKYRRGDRAGAAHNVAAAFHYLQDALDFSIGHGKSDSYVIRDFYFSNLDSVLFFFRKRTDTYKRQYRNTRSQIYGRNFTSVVRFSQNEGVRFISASKKYIHQYRLYNSDFERMVRDKNWSAFKPSEMMNLYSDATDFTIKNIAATVAIQDRILEMFQSHVQ